jgi:hypothetical protein
MGTALIGAAVAFARAVVAFRLMPHGSVRVATDRSTELRTGAAFSATPTALRQSNMTRREPDGGVQLRASSDGLRL